MGIFFFGWFSADIKNITVKVVYDEGQDLFEVHLDNGQVEDMVYADCLVNVIDGLIERTDNYKERVETEYGIHVN